MGEKVAKPDEGAFAATANVTLLRHRHPYHLLDPARARLGETVASAEAEAALLAPLAGPFMTFSTVLHGRPMKE